MPVEWRPNKRLDVVQLADPKLLRQVSRKTNLGVALRMTRRKFWQHFYCPLVTFLECERAYYSMSYVPREDSDFLIQKYHSALEGLQLIVDALDLENRSLPQQKHRHGEEQRVEEEDAPYFSLNHRKSTSSFDSPLMSSIVSSPLRISSAMDTFLSQGVMTPSSFVDLISDFSSIVRTRCGMITALKQLKRTNLNFTAKPSQNTATVTSSWQWARAMRALLKKPTSVSHPLLMGLRAHALYEVKVLSCCMQGQDAIENCQFRDSVVALHQVCYALKQWQSMFPSDERGAQLDKTPPMLRWLSKFYICLRSKSSIYFWGLIQKTELKREPTAADSHKRLGVIGNQDLTSIFQGIVRAGQARGFRTVIALLLTTDGVDGKVDRGQEYCSEYGYSVATSLLRLQEKRRREQEERLQSSDESSQSKRTAGKPPLLTSSLRNLLTKRSESRRHQFQGILSSPVLFTYPLALPKTITKAQAEVGARAKQHNFSHSESEGTPPHRSKNESGKHDAECPLIFLEPHLPNVVAMAMMLRVPGSALGGKDRDGSDISKPIHIFSPPPRKVFDLDDANIREGRDTVHTTLGASATENATGKMSKSTKQTNSADDDGDSFPAVKGRSSSGLETYCAEKVDSAGGTHYYACCIDTRVTLVVVEAPAASGSYDDRMVREGGTKKHSESKPCPDMPEVDEEDSAALTDKRSVQDNGPFQVQIAKTPEYVVNSRSVAHSIQHNDRNFSSIYRHSDLTGSREGQLLSTPLHRDRFASTPVATSSARISGDKNKIHSPRYGAGGSLWYSQSRKQTRSGTEIVSTAREQATNPVASPGRRIMELTTQLAGVLQNKTLASELGPVQGYLSSDDEVSSIKAGDGENTTQQMIESIEKNETKDTSKIQAENVSHTPAKSHVDSTQC